MEIKFYNRQTRSLQIEKVYGEGAVNFIYNTALGRLLWPVVKSSLVSKLYGFYQNIFLSRKKIKPFIKKFQIPMELYEIDPMEKEKDLYKNFNQFFIRRFKPGARPFESNLKKLPAVAEARYLAWPKINDQLHYPVKGNFLNFDLMLANPKWSKIFDQGPMMIARLCPVDYHRFHYPDDGNVIEHWRVQGDLHSVNPLALKYKNDIFCQNERVVSILKTQNFGHLAYIEVGATCVGKIIQSHAWEKSFKRGDEKGYFLFGGSTVILIGEKGKWLPSEDLLSNTQKEIETWVPIGTSVGELLS